VSPAAIIQALVAAGLAALLFFGGRSCGVSSSADRLAEKDRALLQASQQLRAAANALRDVDRIAGQELAQAEEAQRQADFAKERALMAAEDLRRDLARTEGELEEAMRDPGCRAELEKPTCAVLR
jgi:hypothetical protein